MHINDLNADVLNVFNGICYVTDPEGTILSVGASKWTAFSQANAAPGLSAESVVGKSIYDFVLGDDVRDGIREVLAKLRNGEHSEWVMPYRCDGPEQKRNMRLSVTPIFEAGAVVGFLFQSVPLDQEMRPPLDIFDFQQVFERMARLKTLPLVVMCSWCQRLKEGTGAEGMWVEAEDYYRHGGVSEVALSHTICPDCKKKSKSAFAA